MSDFVDVPIASGVPVLLRSATALLPPVAALLVNDLTTRLLGQLIGPQWGLFSIYGLPLLVGDSVLGVDYRNEFDVPTYPIENGGFVSYNKVKKPFDIKLSFSVGGSVAARTAFLDLADELVASTDLFSAVTPEKTYPYVNPVHKDYSRTQRGGATLITVNVYCYEIRLAPDSDFTSTQEDDGANPQVNGQTQTQDRPVPDASVDTGSAFA